MTPATFRQIRTETLQWSINHTASMLRIDPRTVRRYEDGTRRVTGTTQRCLEAFVSGWRPVAPMAAKVEQDHG